MADQIGWILFVLAVFGGGYLLLRYLRQHVGAERRARYQLEQDDYEWQIRNMPEPEDPRDLPVPPDPRNRPGRHVPPAGKR